MKYKIENFDQEKWKNYQFRKTYLKCFFEAHNDSSEVEFYNCIIVKL